MAVISSRVIDEGCDVADRAYSYWATYEVKTDSRTFASRDILDEAVSALPNPIPVYMASYSLFGASDPNAFAQKFTAKRRSVDDSSTIWRIQVEWFLPDGDPDDDHNSDSDPLLRPVRIDGDEEEVEEVVERGWNEEALPGIGRAADTYDVICNGAGKEPGTPLTKPRRLPVLVFTKNFATLAEIMTLAATYVDKLNNATFYGAPAGKAIVRSIRPSEVMHAGNTKYREATIRVAFNDEGWSFEMFNRGYEHLNDTGALVMAEEKDKNNKMRLVTEPINLKLDGKKAAPGEFSVINWRTSAKVNLAGLGVGTG